MENYHQPVKSNSRGTGGKRRKSRDKVLAHWGHPPTATKLGKKEVREQKAMRGSGAKVKLKTAMFVNLLTKQGMKKTAIRNVTETPDNRHHARQNILTKGAIVDTELGKAKITNRVGQDGVVNGVLL